MKKICILSLFIVSTLLAQEGHLIPNPIRNIPKWVRTEFTSRYLDNNYMVSYQLYPYYLHADFNDDSRRDVAIQIVEKKSGKAGIAIFHAKKLQAISIPISIIGAGTSLSGIGDDLKWVNFWNVFNRKDASNKKSLPSFDGNAITIGQRDSTSGLIYWDGKKYSWHRIKK
jgi:hypothetical protein